ncbi:hypothetical protein DIPPA_03605 [Diplonema papillatum]|nr:hypothetical protein DIPPA_14054 [Diplonema papillatum]KAJ9438965.1 hypothetical protein DIPPA_03605 [Diplonema papillatum]
MSSCAESMIDYEAEEAAAAFAKADWLEEHANDTEAYESWQAQEEQEHAMARLDEEVAMAIDREGAEAAEAPAANPQTPAQEHPQTPPQERF